LVVVRVVTLVLGLAVDQEVLELQLHMEQAVLMLLQDKPIQ
jgi:hypothetical protein